MKRFTTLDCLNSIGKQVTISGFLISKRDHGNLLFLEVKDYDGIMQVVIENPSKAATSISLQSTVSIVGIIRKRVDDQVNPNRPTGAIEMVGDDVHIYSRAVNVPFLPEDNISEQMQLTHRPLYLRSNHMQECLAFRSRMFCEMVSFMSSNGFKYIQTPILTASSPEGARDFLVPSRLHKGKFYALPQSPQIFKQMLMVGGLDKYFQIAPCFRDEDARLDRAYGYFTQLDLECAFAKAEDIQDYMKDFFKHICAQLVPNKTVSIHDITHEESMNKYGSDKPNMCNPLHLEDFTSLFEVSSMEIFTNMIRKGALVKGIRCKNVIGHRRILETIEQQYGFKIAYMNNENGDVKGPIAKFIDNGICGLNETIFFVCDVKDNLFKKCDKVIRYLGDHLNLIDKNHLAFVLVKDFPMFELDDGNNIQFAHNPFSIPKSQITKEMSKDQLMECKAHQFDFVLNGFEICSGSQRNIDLDVLRDLFEICGYTVKDFEEKFACFNKGFKYGVPPHAGCAVGFERFIMILIDRHNIRDVEAFPLTTNGGDLFMECPTTVNDRQLKELHIKVVEAK